MKKDVAPLTQPKLKGLNMNFASSLDYIGNRLLVAFCIGFLLWAGTVGYAGNLWWGVLFTSSCYIGAIGGLLKIIALMVTRYLET